MTPVAEAPSTLDRETSSRASDRWLHQETWAASRAKVQRIDKLLMAQHFAEHDFLLQPGSNPSTSRENTASLLVNGGTGPNMVADACLKWIEEHASEGPFHLTWYSPGALVPATLYDFREKNPDLTASTHVHLFPGTVDIQIQGQVAPEAQEYARKLTRQFSFMILSGHSFDLETGQVRFFFDREIPIQRICALLQATEKYLFFDSHKFSGEGEIGYSLRELFGTCRRVVVYTVASPRSDEVKAAFDELAKDLITKQVQEAVSSQPKSLRLTIVGQDGVPSRNFNYDGLLRTTG